MSTKAINHIKDSTISVVMLMLSIAIVGYLFLIFPILRNRSINFATVDHSSQAIRPTEQNEKRQKHDSSQPWTYNFSNLPDGPLNRREWNFQEGNAIADYNREEQTYTSRMQNIRIENGALVIEAKVEELNGKKYSSARIDTHGIFDFQYGTLEVEAILPEGVGTWPAAWQRF